VNCDSAGAGSLNDSSLERVHMVSKVCQNSRISPLKLEALICSTPVLEHLIPEDSPVDVDQVQEEEIPSENMCIV